MIKLVIFDMDGTLIDSEKNGIRLWNEAGKKFGYDILEEDVISMIGKNKVAIKNDCINRFGEEFPYEEISKLRKDLDKDSLISPMPFAKEALEKISSLGIKMCVATSSSKEPSINLLKSLGLFNNMEFLVSGDEVENSKPCPDIFIKCMELLNIKECETIVVEDSKNGIIAAKRSGATSVLIPDMVPVDEEMKANADYILNNLKELSELVEGTYLKESNER